MVCRNHNVSMRIGLCAIFISLCGLSMSLCGCSQKALHEAIDVVAQADSLRAEGQLYTDSVQLANAYETLDKWQVLYPDDYAHACYHYGRLLRSQDNPVEAMQVFINATHSRTHDYHILGRVYSNMAELCQLENNRDLAYDMHNISANYFKRGGNMQLYFYALNNMAIQRAQQRNKGEATNLLSQIERECTDSAVLTKVIETKALACRHSKEYDSTIYYVHILESMGYQEILGDILKAQAFWYLQQYDSALHYANNVLSRPCSLDASVSMMYITSHNDPSIDIDSVLVITSERADKQFEITHMQAELSHAVEILQQDISRPYDWRWIFIVIGIITLFGGGIGVVYAYRRTRIIKRNAELLRKTLEQKCEALIQLSDKQLQETIYWKDYNALCHYMNAHMNDIINKLFHLKPNLTEQNIRLCIVTLIGFPYLRCAEMLRLSKSSISKSKQIMADKLGTDIKTLRTYLMDLACKNM